MDGIAGTIIVAVILVVCVGIVIRKMLRDKKNGRSITCSSCNGDCSNCTNKR